MSDFSCDGTFNLSQFCDEEVDELIRIASETAAGDERREAIMLAEAAILYQWLKDAGIRHLHVHFSNVAADVARLVVQIGRRIDGPDAGWRWSIPVIRP